MTVHFEEEYVTPEELMEAYCDCRKRKRHTLNAYKFEMHESENLYQLWYDLNSLTYKVGRSITFVVDKPVKREIFAADFRDRIVHHLLVKRILHLFESDFIDDTYSCREGKGTWYGVKRCADQIRQCSEDYSKPAYVLKCDLKSFFMTINKAQLYDMLVHFLEDFGKISGSELEFDKWLTKLIIFNNPQDNCIRKQSKSHWNGLPKNKSLFSVEKGFGLPIGNLTSQLFANFYLSWFDHWIKEDLGIKYYGRYVDDFYLVSGDKEELKRCIPLIRQKLADFGVILHPKKLYLQDIYKGVKFIGSVIKPNRIYISSRTKGSAWQALKEVTEILQDCHGEKSALEYCESVMNSYLGFMMDRNTFNVRKQLLDNPQFKFIWEYFYHDGDYTKVMLYENYMDGIRHRKPHQYKELYKLNNNRKECIEKIQQSTLIQANTLSSDQQLDILCQLEKMNPL